LNTIDPALAVEARHVLAINVTRIGDTLLNTPALRAIARHFPNAAITCLGHAKRVEVLQHLPYLNKIGDIDKKSAPFRGRLGTLTGHQYDWAFVWGHDTALHRYALRKARHVVAYRQADDALNQRFFHAVDAPALYTLHGVAMQLALPQAVGIGADGYALDYVVSAAEQRAAQSRLANEVGDVKPLIGLQVASFPTKAYRDWPMAHFIALAKRIVDQHPRAKFVMFGGPDDVARIEPFRAALPDRTLVLAGSLTLRETVAVMNEIDLYLGVDTGPTHLYGALGKPMVAMYHPSLPSALYKPLRHRALYVVDHPEAGPHASSDIAMADISVEDVWERVVAALAHAPSVFPGMPPVGIDVPAWPARQ
jgi:heptosyltransferase III